MKKIGDLMEELGFRKEASYEAKKAFLTYLVKSAGEVEKVKHIEIEKKKRGFNPIEKPTESTPAPEQLEFDFSYDKEA